MSYIETSSIKNSTIMLMYSERDEICLNPTYQRMGGIWTLEKKQLLIDSILNDYDIPKIYFHKYSSESISETGFNYAVIDGRQRLETIWAFVNGDFTLADDFVYQRDPFIELAGLSYNDMGNEFPKMKIKFDSFVLPVISVDTDDIDLIEDMFYRLNEAVPLNAAEKRNSIGGDMVNAIRTLSQHNLFTNNVKYRNNRYQHMESAARFLLIEENLQFKSHIFDTKKVYLDALAKNYYRGEDEKVNDILSSCSSILDIMADIFTNSDVLLSAQGNMTIYYLLFRNAINNNQVEKITRRKFINFRDSLKQNRIMASLDYEKSLFELLEYDRLTQQGTNDASNIKERLKLLSKQMGVANDEHIE